MSNPQLKSPEPERIRWQAKIPGGSSFSHVLKRGTILRLTDLEGDANASAMFYNFELPVERYNMPDTLKGQHTAFLTEGNALYSDMGRVLVSIVADTCGWHDTICGHSTRETIRRRFGEASYQQHRNDCYRNARDCFLSELEKYGLGPRDLTASVNFFSKVVVDADGNLAFQPGHSHPGDVVDLRAEMNTLVVLNTCPHPLTTATSYPRKPVQATIFSADPVAPDDACRMSCPQNERAFTNTERYFL